MERTSNIPFVGFYISSNKSGVFPYTSHFHILSICKLSIFMCKSREYITEKDYTYQNVHMTAHEEWV